MAIKITVPDMVYFGENIDVSWSGSTGNIVLEMSTDGKLYKQVYSGTDTEYSAPTNVTADYDNVYFKVTDESGNFAFSTAVSVVYVWVEETDNCTNYLQPFGIVIDFNSSTIPYLPSSRETSQQIAGLDGEVLLDMKYNAREFVFSCFTQNDLDYSQREELSHKTAAYLDLISGNKQRYFLYKSKLFRVCAKDTSFNFAPSYLKLDTTLKCYDCFAVSAAKEIIGKGNMINNGDRETYPVLYLYGALNNPTIKINDKEYQIAIDTQDGDITEIDCDKRTITIIRNGQRINAAGAWYLEYPVFGKGFNSVNSGVNRTVYRERYMVL